MHVLIVMINWMNLLGLMFGAAGSLLLAIFGLPNPQTLSSGSYTAIESTPAIRRAQQLSSLGLWLLCGGFVIQGFTQLIHIYCA